MTRKCRGRLRRRCKTRQVKLLKRLGLLCRVSLPMGAVWSHYIEEAAADAADAPRSRTDQGEERTI